MKVIFEAIIDSGKKKIRLSKALDLPFVPAVGTQVETEEFEGEVKIRSVAINLEKKGLAWFRVRLSPVTLKRRNAVNKYVEDAIRDRGWERGWARGWRRIK